jgi:UV DNA damage endonuclease
VQSTYSRSCIMIVRYGYACINTVLRDKNIYVGRTMQRKKYDELGVSECSRIALANIKDMLEILKWNIENNIEVYRMSSDMIPWNSEYDIEKLPDYSSIRSVLEECGDFAKKNNIRLSFHPGPFNCLGSEDGAIVNKTIAELNKHSILMDIMGLPRSHMAKINIHIGGSYGDKMKALTRFAKNFVKLDTSTKSRLTVENDDRESMFGVLDLYALHKYINIPIVFDGHHYEVGAKNELSYEEAYSLAYSTWNCTPTFHWSNSAKEFEQGSNSKTAHSNIYYKPMGILDIGDLDIILEAKNKEQALIKYKSDFTSS